VNFRTDDAAEVFNLLDTNKTGQLGVEEFITGCVRMRGDANSRDLFVAQVALDSMMRHSQAYESNMKRLTKKIGLLQATANALTNQAEHHFLTAQEFRYRHPEAKFKEVGACTLTEAELAEAPWHKDNFLAALDDRPEREECSPRSETTSDS
jgi:hypothetical protein